MARRDDPVVIEVALNGVHESNAELVEEVVAMANEVGRRIATPAETAKLFGFPRA